MIPLTHEENNLYNEQEVCYICKNWFARIKIKKKKKEFKLQKKVIDHCHYTGKFRGAAYSICNLKYKVSKKFPIIIHNPSYDTFILNQLAKEFKDQLNCIGDNMEKHITFSVPIKK